MLIIKNTFILFISILLISLNGISFSAYSSENNLSTMEQRISQIEFLFRKNAEKLSYNEVVELSNQIILQRDKYPNEILAKTYLLLANVASNKGELETAYQFTKDGLDITTGQKNIRLCLQIKLASIYSAKKQYRQLLKTAQQAIAIPQDNESTKYFLFALSYRSVAFAVLNQHESALIDLKKVEDTIKKNPSFAEHITLLTILASAYYHLEDYQTALTMHLKILKLRFNLDKLDNVDQTYYQLAHSYYQLNRFNDAYNAYWEAKRYAEKKSAQIYIAYASQGLGLTLIKQNQLAEARIEIIKAKNLFYQNNLASPYLETIISLALLNNMTGKSKVSHNLLLEAEKLSTSVELTGEYIILYQLLAALYKNKDDINKAYFWQKKYSNALLKSHKQITKDFSPSLKNTITATTLEKTNASNQSNQLAIKLAEQSELATSFAEKYRQQQAYIFILSALIVVLFFLVMFIWLKHRATKLKNAHEALEKPSHFITPPVQTKQLYQQSFNMARKYSYPLTIGYISLSNWQELQFQFSKKIVAEVNREIASVINSHIGEFENAGLINEGEYLLLFPHQSKDEVALIIEKLVSALKLRFFANLGEFSVIISFSIESPNFQDIDPYIFLSQLSDSMKIA